MSTFFIGRLPPPQEADQTVRSDNLPMSVMALLSVVTLFLLGSVILFACNWFTDSTNSAASPPPLARTWRRWEHVETPVPAMEATVAALPVVREAREGCCAVCLVEFEGRESVKLIPACGHAFHPDCIDAWLLSRGSCPVCRCSDLSGTNELRLDVVGGERDGEEGKEEKAEHSLELGRRSCSTRMEMERMGGATVNMRRSSSF